MKKLVLLVSVGTLVGGVFAFQGTKPKPKKAEKTPTKVHCPIMKEHTVDIAKATKTKMYADYKGRRYFFCCGGCPAVFKENPEKYRKSESIPVPKKK